MMQNETCVLEYTGFGKLFIVSHKMSPGAFVQMAMMIAYYRLYGKLVNTYEPVMTKNFYHGRTAACRSASLEAGKYCQWFDSPAIPLTRCARARINPPPPPLDLRAHLP
jgi:carnitine O-acetyltransferase